MKRIIAAALSILVGAFGYTIVDQKIEDRVATLESQVVELQQEVDGYHSAYDSSETTEYTTQKGTPLKKGDYINLLFAANSTATFFKYENGNVEGFPYDYLHSYNTTGPISPPYNSTNLISVTYDENGYDQGGFTQPNYKKVKVNITDISAKIQDIETETTYYNYLGEDYERYLYLQKNTTTHILFTCRGNADISLAGYEIHIDGAGSPYPQKVISNTITNDGSFEYTATYKISKEFTDRAYTLNNDYFVIAIKK